MGRARQAVTIAWMVLAAGVFTSCVAPDASAPATASSDEARYDRVLSLPSTTDYTGEIKPGRFIVCTSRFSPAGLYDYEIEVVNALPSDRHVSAVSVANGQCVIVFWTNRRGGPEPLVYVRPVPFVPTTATVYDQSSIENGFVAGEGFLSRLVPTFNPPYRIELAGLEGAIAKFYYQPAGIRPCQVATVCQGGNHGGPGTLLFELE